ncbi:AraC family transcriptional regulator [Solitalea longa]|uniref:AraC family transcriptional regulator n=1 Tax=Solitalea longa TaxID=2079460 RepID=A0A2S5A092_9SPHI|nr:helix-turn-helix domain-containing protein [Solitalea longa]POY35739.1 AraC family transcriptional regulator [Solitalea longa]
MKPCLLNVTTGLAQSFSARNDTQPDINNRWHYHETLELIYFRKGNGTQFIGDSIQYFKEGDVVLVGSNLPHYWRFDPAYFENPTENPVDIFVVHFKQDFWGADFLNIPENQELKKLIEQAGRGIQIAGKTKDYVASLIERIVKAQNSRKVILLLEALTEISACKEVSYLVSMGFKYDFLESEKDRIQAIYNYTIANYKKKIELKEIAAVAKISPNSFCKFFKSRSRKTYTQFINEIRVGHACKLLIENKLTVKEVCYESGFYNFASFHKYFREITGKSPLKYQQTFG